MSEISPRMNTDKTAKLLDDVVRIVRDLPSWKNQAVFFAIGKSGMCYRKADGARTFLMDFPNGSAGPGCKPFAFDTIEEAERFLDWLQAHRANANSRQPKAAS